MNYFTKELWEGINSRDRAERVRAERAGQESEAVLGKPREGRGWWIGEDGAR